MTENAIKEGLLVRAEEISQRIVNVVRVMDGALLLETDAAWAGAINTMLVTKGVTVNELRRETRAG